MSAEVWSTLLETARGEGPLSTQAALLADRHISGNISGAALVGSSAGGAFGLDVALEHPDQVERLALRGPVFHGLGVCAQCREAHCFERDRGKLDPVSRGDVRAAATDVGNDQWPLAPGHDEVRRTVFETLLANPRHQRRRADLERRPPCRPLHAWVEAQRVREDREEGGDVEKT